MSVSGKEDAPQKGRSHRNNFDFLRLCFASFVILSHSPELVDGDRHRELLTRTFHTLSFGEVGVAGFFILSGYLISQSWEQRPRLLDFFRNRVLRIYPGFIVAALLTGLVFGPIGADARQYFAQFNYVAFAKSVLELAVPATPPTQIGNGSLWTIQAEFKCYVLVGVVGAIGLSKLRFCAPLMLVPIALLFIKKGVLLGPYNLYGFFLAGMSFYHLRDRIALTARGSVAAALLLLAGLTIHRVAAWLAVCTAGAYLLFAFAFCPIPWLQRGARHADVSYGTYLYAWPLQRLIIHVWPGASPWAVLAISLPASMGCGWLSWRTIEMPFLRLKKRAPKTTPALSAVQQGS